MAADLPERYVRLVRGVDALLPGFVDSYAGPAGWTPVADPDPDRLGEEVAALRDALPGLDDPARARWLAGQLQAAETALAMVRAERGGAPLAYVDEVRGLFGVEARRVPDAELVRARAALADALPGAGDLTARYEALRARLAVPGDRIIDVLRAASDVLRERARAILPLPAGEAFAWEPVRGKPWPAYNWYLGDLQSRNEINVDLPHHLQDVPEIVSHEGYPGHHVERCAKTTGLVATGLRPECTAQLLLAPEATLSEAIAVCALEVVLDEDGIAGLLEELAPRAGVALDGETLAGALAAIRFGDIAWDVQSNAALLRHVEGAGDDDVVAYVMEHTLEREVRARQVLAFIDETVSRSYVFTYSEGRRLLRGALAAAPDAAGRRAVYRRALEQTLTPDDLRAAG